MSQMEVRSGFGDLVYGGANALLSLGLVDKSGAQETILESLRASQAGGRRSTLIVLEPRPAHGHPHASSLAPDSGSEARSAVRSQPPRQGKSYSSGGSRVLCL